jgi:putative ABC transport system permease protein
VIDGRADPARLAAGEVLIGAGLARRQQIRAGDTVRLVTPSGPVELPVQGVWEEGNNVGVNITMSTARMEELLGPQPLDFVSLSPADGVSEVELAEQLRGAGLDPELRVRRSAEIADDIADQIDQQFASFRVMQAALMAVLFIAVLTSLLLAAIQRRRELGLLAAVGADPPGLARTLLVEAALVAGIGVALSTVAGPITMYGINQVVPFMVGFRNPLTLEWWSLGLTGALAIVVAVVGAVWPAARAARVEVLDALRYE